MAQTSRRNGPPSRHRAPTKYDAHNLVLDRTYGALADLRRELADSKQDVAEPVLIFAILSPAGVITLSQL